MATDHAADERAPSPGDVPRFPGLCVFSFDATFVVTGVDGPDPASDQWGRAIIGHHVADLVPADRAGDLLDRLARVLEGESVTVEIRAVDGSGRLDRLDAVPRRTTDDTVVGGFVVVRDVTEYRRRSDLLRTSEARYHQLVDEAPDMLAVFDPAGVHLDVSAASSRLFGWEPAELIGVSGYDLYHPDDLERIREAHDALLDVGDPASEHVVVTYRLRGRDGRYHRVEVIGRPVVDPDSGDLVALHAVTREISHRETSDVRFRSLFDDAPAPLALVEHVPGSIGEVRAVNRALTELLGLPAEAVTRLGLDLVHPADRPAAAALFTEVLLSAASGAARDLEVRVDPVGGPLRWVRLHVAPFTEFGQALVHVQDITGERTLKEELEHRSLHDPLTELPNRVLILDRLVTTIADAPRRGTHLAALFIDVDRLKAVNDRLGHAVGDALLVEIARRIVEAVRPGDSVGRLAGDEFVVVCPGLSPLRDVADGEATRVADRIVAAVGASPLDGHDDVVPSVCIGVAVSDGGEPADEVLAEADARVYEAKRAGRGTSRTGTAPS